jgi:hypothetical protein
MITNRGVFAERNSQKRKARVWVGWKGAPPARNKKGEEMRMKSTAPFFPKAKSEGCATRKIRGKIE